MFHPLQKGVVTEKRFVVLEVDSSFSGRGMIEKLEKPQGGLQRNSCIILSPIGILLSHNCLESDGDRHFEFKTNIYM